MSEIQPTPMPIELLVEWFNENARATDADETSMMREIESSPVLSDPVTVANRDKEISRILARKKILLDFKGFLLAHGDLEGDALQAWLSED